MMIRKLCIVSTMALVAACTSMPTGMAAPVAEAARSMEAPASADYVRMAAAGDQYEIQSSRLVLETSQDAELRRFAQMMVDHHTLTTQSLMTAVQREGLPPPAATLDPPKAEMLAALRAATGPERDRLYREQQLAAHREALQLHARYGANGPDGALRTNALAAVPVVSRHYNTITGMVEPREDRLNP